MVSNRPQGSRKEFADLINAPRDATKHREKATEQHGGDWASWLETRVKVINAPRWDCVGVPGCEQTDAVADGPGVGEFLNQAIEKSSHLPDAEVVP